MPASAEGQRSATSPVPNTRASAHAITYHSGGVFSVCTTERSVAQQARVQHVHRRERLVVPEALQVERRQNRSAAASSVSATSGHHAQATCARARPRGPAALRQARSPRSSAPRRAQPCVAGGTPALLAGAEAAVAARRARLLDRPPTYQPPCTPRRPCDHGPADHQAQLRARFRRARASCCRTRPRARCWSPSSSLVDRQVVVVVAGVGAPRAQVGDQAVVDVALCSTRSLIVATASSSPTSTSTVVSISRSARELDRARPQRAEATRSARLRVGAGAHYTGANSGASWWTMNRPCTKSVATSRRRSRVTTRQRQRPEDVPAPAATCS